MTTKHTREHRELHSDVAGLIVVTADGGAPTALLALVRELASSEPPAAVVTPRDQGADELETARLHAELALAALARERRMHSVTIRHLMSAVVLSAAALNSPDGPREYLQRVLTSGRVDT